MLCYCCCCLLLSLLHWKCNNQLFIRCAFAMLLIWYGLQLLLKNYALLLPAMQPREFHLLQHLCGGFIATLVACCCIIIIILCAPIQFSCLNIELSMFFFEIDDLCMNLWSWRSYFVIWFQLRKTKSIEMVSKLILAFFFSFLLPHHSIESYKMLIRNN